MKIKQGFVMREVAGQHIAIATSEASKTFHGMVKINETGALIWEGIEQGKTADEIAGMLTETYDVSAEKAAADVAKFVSSMSEQGLLE